MRMLAHIADRIIGRPLLIHPRKAQIIVAVLGERIGADGELDGEVDQIFLQRIADKPAANRLIGEPGGPRDALGRVAAHLYNMVDGTAVIPVVGSLVNRGAFIGDDGSGFTSYEGLQVQVQEAMHDPFVSSILLDIESPGGETAGAFSLFETIREARKLKRVTALVNDMAASAAYGIAAQADEIVVSPGSITGSVGVVMLHMDRSEQMRKRGIKPTFIYAGAKKVDGNPLEPLTDDVRADLQREVDLLYGQFVGAVADGRRSLSPEAIRGSEAGIFIGAEAVKLGFADRVGNFNETVQRLSSAAPRAIGGPTMTDRTFTQVELDAATASARAEAQSAAALGAANIVAARIRAILTHEEAEGREALARQLALDTEMTAEAAVAIMKTTPKISAAPRVPTVSERAPAPVPTGAEPKQNGGVDWEAIYEKQNKMMGVVPHPLLG